MQALKNLLHHHHHTPPAAPFTVPVPLSPPQPGTALHSPLQPAPVVPHTRQGATWDCGLACLLSLLTTHHIPTTLPQLRSLLTSDSVWTVDLLALLAHYQLHAVLYTTYTGANPSHSTKQFYSTQWTADSQRITRLFQLYDTPTGTAGVRVERRALDADSVYGWLERGSLVLLLVDPRYLHCPHCHTHQSLTLSSHFLGHFILLTRCERRATTSSSSSSGNEQRSAIGFGRRSGGLDRSEAAAAGDVRLLWYMDPASDGCAECVCSESWMERARKSDGTDEDCIVILGRDQPNITTAADTQAAASAAVVVADGIQHVPDNGAT